MAVGPTILLFVAATAFGNRDLGCSGPDNWAAGSAYAQLKNSGLLKPDTVDFAKTRVELLAQEKIGKDLYRQVHEITFTLKSGSIVRVVTTNNASAEECSMGEVKVRVVGQILGGQP
jgi:hypothetical protein